MEEIQHFSHGHTLTFCPNSRQKLTYLMLSMLKGVSGDEKINIQLSERDIERYLTCKGCNQAVDGEGYFCETCKNFWLHKSCSLLSHELHHHPLHSSHPLILMAKPPGPKLFRFGFSSLTYFICDECRDFCPGFAYHCAECQFNLDVKCALITDGRDQHHRLSRQLLDTKPEIYHPSHIHQLIPLNSTSLLLNYACCVCGLLLQGPVYGCCECEHFLHESCASIRQEIQQHPYHPQHPLLLRYDEKRKNGKFICDGCLGISSGFAFQCEHCQIKLDVKCALLTDGSLGQKSEEREINTQISHFGHHHELLLFNNVREERPLKCTGCQSTLSGLGYCCLECEFYIHKSCAEMPRVIQHSYHLVHPLHAQTGIKYDRGGCGVCKHGTLHEEIVYHCSECFFALHLICAKVSLGVAPALKHDCHEHSLYYFVGNSTLLKYGKIGYEYDSRKFLCFVCVTDCLGPCYICLECEGSFHLECIPIPQVVFKPDSHMHPLTLRRPLVAADDEDSSKEYYCFACEKERNPKYHAYHCEARIECIQCPYEAHIECMVSECVEEYYNSASTSNNVDEIKGVPESPPIAECALPQCRRQLEIEDFSNSHVMICHEISDSKKCYGCKRDILTTAYTCEFCNISFHIYCVELPLEIRHPLHLLHPLKFFKVRIYNVFCKCDGCATVSRFYEYYRCEECSFILDIKCASIKDKRQILEERHDNVMISHFSHKHRLLLANCSEDDYGRCHVCLLHISGPSYCCTECRIFIHESCSKVERVIHQNPFHPHPLLWTDSHLECQACKLAYWGAFLYCCSKCSFYIHYACSKYLSSTLKYENHEHSLFHFAAKDLCSKDLTMLQYIGQEVPKFLCKVCQNDCNESFLRCMECDLNLHLQCMALPQRVKGAFHMHPVTLLDSVVQDYYDEQYCYACEDIRNPNHAVYSCEECIYIAHIGCVLDEADDSLQIFPSSVACPQSRNLIMEFGETSREVDCEVVLVTGSIKENNKEPLVIVDVDEEIQLLEREMDAMKSK